MSHVRWQEQWLLIPLAGIVQFRAMTQYQLDTAAITYETTSLSPPGGSWPLVVFFPPSLGGLVFG